MKTKKFILSMKKIFLLTTFALTILSVNAQSNTTDEGVVINGIKWATRNVDKPGTFATNPENDGMLYQWNRKTAWTTTGFVYGWDSSIPTGSTWEKANDPSPAGWHVPTYDELASLCDHEKVSYELAIVNGAGGIRLTDKTSGESIFLPAVGMRYIDGTLLGFADYWSSTTFGDTSAAFLAFVVSTGEPDALGAYSRNCAFSIRSVADEGVETAIAKVNLAKQTVSVSSSPATDFISISGLQNNEKFSIYNINGQQLFSGKATGETQQIAVGHFPTGIYLLKVDNGQTLKFLKK